MRGNRTVKRLLIWVIVLGVIGGISAAAYSNLPASWRGSASARYRQMPVLRGSIEAVVNSTGTIQPVLSVQIGSFVSGPIETTNVDFNSRVKKGDILAKIDPRTFNAKVKQDEASLNHRKADRERVAALLEQARKNEKRARSLRATKASYISETELDKVEAERKSLEAQLKLADATVEEAEAALSLSKANVDYTIIKSPVDGIIVDRKVDPGQTVAAQFQTPVMFVVAPDMEKRMYVYASVDEADIGMIRAAKDRNEPVSFTVDAYSEDLFEGTIYQVRLNPTTVQNVVTYTVVVEAPNPELKLLPGMTANLSFRVEKRDDVVKVPNAALRFYPRPEQVHEEFKELLEGTAPYLRDPNELQPTLSAAERSKSSVDRTRRHVWVLDGELLRAVEVVIGLSDSSHSELISGDLTPDQKLVTGMRAPGFGPG